MLSSATKPRKLFFIGSNEYGQFGLNHKKNLDKLTECSNPVITRVFIGGDHMIFSDDEYSNIYAAGSNKYGQCSIG